MALQFGQVKKWACATVNQFLGVVEEVEAKIEQTGRDGTAADLHMPLLQVPATGAHHQQGGFFVEGVLFARVGREIHLPPNGIAQIGLPFNQVVPCGGVGILKIGHEHIRARIHGVDDHFAVSWACDFDPPLL